MARVIDPGVDRQCAVRGSGQANGMTAEAAPAPGTGARGDETESASMTGANLTHRAGLAGEG
jgi:hypothetical protein